MHVLRPTVNVTTSMGVRVRVLGRGRIRFIMRIKAMVRVRVMMRVRVL